MGEEGTGVLGRVLADSSELALVQNAKLHRFKLEAVGEHLLHKLAQSVQENNRAESLGDVVRRFIRFRNNNRGRSLKYGWPMAACKAGVGYPRK